MGFLEGQFRVVLNSEQRFYRGPPMVPEVVGEVTDMYGAGWWESPCRLNNQHAWYTHGNRKKMLSTNIWSHYMVLSSLPVSLSHSMATV